MRVSITFEVEVEDKHALDTLTHDLRAKHVLTTIHDTAHVTSITPRRHMRPAPQTQATRNLHPMDIELDTKGRELLWTGGLNTTIHATPDKRNLRYKRMLMSTWNHLKDTFTATHEGFNEINTTVWRVWRVKGTEWCWVVSRAS